MSIFTNVQTYFQNRYDRKLQKGLMRLDIKMKQEPRFQKLAGKYLTSKRFMDKLTENFIWYIGDENLIRYFFKGDSTSQRVLGEDMELNQFWRVCPDNYIMVHTGFPGVISAKMSKAVLGNGYDIEVEVFKKSNKEGELETVTDQIDDDESGRIKDMLQDVLLKETGFKQMLLTAGQDESWSGHIAMKFAFDRSVSPYPIIEEADLRFFEVEKVRGKTKSIVFKEWFAKGDAGSQKKYRLDEIYTTVQDDVNGFDLAYCNQFAVNGIQGLEVGDAVIKYELYDITDETNQKPVVFNNWMKQCPELTKNIEQEAYSYPKFKGMLAFEKPNKMPNVEFPGSIYGASDYARLAGAFHTVDELYSEDSREVRDNKGLQAIPRSWLPKDEDGKAKARNKFQTNIVIDDSDADQHQGNAPAIQSSEIQDKTESILGKWKLKVNQICVQAGISPTTLGIYGFESIASSDKSQQEREKATIDTRKDKIELWKPFIEDMLLKLLMFNSWLREAYPDLKQPGIDAMDIDFTNCNVKVNFPDYVKANVSERIDTWGKAKSMRLVDTLTAIEKVYPEKTKTEQEQIANLIKLEDNMAIDSPEALSMNNLLKPDTQPAEGGNK
jgi:hypothetical protein